MSIISITDLHKTYNGDIHAVQGLDLTIRKGEVYGFLGPNGAGKSTTIKMIIGLLKSTSGKIRILDYSMPDEADKIISKIGYVPQDLIFYNHLTVRENLVLFSTLNEIDDYNEKIDKIMELLEIESLSKRRADTLSGGQKRRLNLAIGLLHEPEILILDEPSAGMDPQSRNILWESIRDVASHKNVTIILTTHLMETVDRIADRVGIIDNGKIIAEGTPEELKGKYGKGDVLEIQFNEMEGFDWSGLENKLTMNFSGSVVSIQNNHLRLLMPNIIANFASIVNQLESSVGKENIRSITMHENTLEDVFIQLTGRELRE